MSTAVATTATTSRGILLPAYHWSVDSLDWERIINTRRDYPSIPISLVVNNNNITSPDIIQNDNNRLALKAWTNLLTSLHDTGGGGVTILGYVNSNFAQDSLELVQDKVETWRENYPTLVDGIFFDNMSNQTTDKEFYKSLRAFAKYKGFKTTVGNAKKTVPPDFVGVDETFDTIVIKDSPFLDTVDSSYFQYAGFQNNKQALAVMAHSVPLLDARWVIQVAQYVGWIYCTDATDSLYGKLPDYWFALVQLLYEWTTRGR